MEIKLHTSVTPLSRPPVGNVPTRTCSATDSTQFEKSEQINAALHAIPEARQEKVERAEQLIGDVAYPPPETIRRLATLLAMHLDTPAS